MSAINSSDSWESDPMEPGDAEPVEQEAMIAQLREAFPVTKPGKDDLVVGDPHHSMARDANEVLSGQAWPDVSAEQLISCYTVPYILTPSAFIVYLPALLIAGMRDLEDGNLLDRVLDKLSLEPAIGNRSGFDRAQLSPAQQACVRAFLEYLVEHARYVEDRRRAEFLLSSGWSELAL